MKLLKLSAAIILASFVFIIVTGLIIQRNKDEEAKQACADEIHRVTRVSSTADQANAYIQTDPMVRAACNKLQPGMVP